MFTAVVQIAAVALHPRKGKLHMEQMPPKEVCVLKSSLNLGSWLEVPS